jgi:putative acetyltransferase
MHPTSLRTRPEQSDDCRAIWQVNHASFGSDAEPNLVDQLRASGYVSVSHVAELSDQIVGHILFSRVSIVTRRGNGEALSLAPMAVLPEYQRQGIGSELVLKGLDACRIEGHKIVIVLGHPNFYPRFGFSAELAKPLTSPFGPGPQWMALELVAGAMTGIEGHVVYAPPFQSLPRNLISTTRPITSANKARRSRFSPLS